jgi:hypothetical protein
VPANLANAPGAVAFTSSDLGPLLSIPFHVAANLNDGLYGNSNSWIGGNAGNPYAAIRLATLSTVTSIAFGRDNGNGDFDDDPAGTDACGGQCDDRSLGIYTLQFTAVATPDGSTLDTGLASTGWQSIGTLNYVSTEDIAPGGAFTAHLRHEYGLGAGVQATGFRLLVPPPALMEAPPSTNWSSTAPRCPNPPPPSVCSAASARFSCVAAAPDEAARVFDALPPTETSSSPTTGPDESIHTHPAGGRRHGPAALAERPGHRHSLRWFHHRLGWQ